MAKTKALKKTGVTHKKNETSVRFSPREKFLRKQLQAKRHRAWKAGLEESFRRSFPHGRGILYRGKLVRNWDTHLAVAKILAEELRADVRQGARRLAGEVEWRWNWKGFVPKMLIALVQYLEDEQPVFDKVDYKIVDILEQHPDFTIKQITSALNEQFPNLKWDALTRRVQRFLENVPWFPKEHADTDMGGWD